jgi:nucleoside-diphosphate-sugar epimerase
VTTVAVTGAAGFVGRPLCRRLVARGFAVRALVRDPAALRAASASAATPGAGAAGGAATSGGRAAPALDVRRCELPDGVDADALRGVDVLVHAAWATKETDPERARRVNEDGTRRLLAAADAAGVARRVFVSSVAAAADAPSRYGQSKHAVEAWFDRPGDLVVRPGLVLATEGEGLFAQLMGAARRLHVVPLFGGGRQPLQTVHVDDLCDAVARAIAAGLAGTLTIAEPEPLALGDFLRMATARLGIRCAFVPVPFAPALLALRLAERAGVALPLRSESLLGMQGMRRVPVGDDLARLGVRIRPARESVEAIAAAAQGGGGS